MRKGMSRWKAGKKITVLLVTVSLLVTGCTKSAVQDVPELREPVSRISACRPVERGFIGEVRVLMATVMPTEYAHFFEMGAQVNEIKVEVGDYVKKGDVLAYANIGEAKRKKKEMKEQVRQAKKKFALQQKISEQQKKELRLSGGSGLRAKLAVFDEESAYAEQLLRQELKGLEDQIKEEEKTIRSGTLRACHTGYVTFCKNLEKTPEAEPNENIVVVADRKQRYLRADDVDTKNYLYRDYKEKYIISGGKRCPVKEIQYYDSDLIVDKNTAIYPDLRFYCPEQASLKLGDSCLIYFCEQERKEVLVIGNDSLHVQGDEYFVYVKNDAGDEEKRIVTVGEKDEYRTEIKSGLAEGEKVCYSSTSALPETYGTLTLERTEYRVTSRSGSSRFVIKSPSVVLSGVEGTVVESHVAQGDKIKKGDLLYVVDTGKSNAALTDQAYQIQKEKDAREADLREIRKQRRSELRGKKGKLRQAIEQRWNYEEELAQYTHAVTLRQMEAQYEADKAGNDGGRKKVYAERGGTITACWFQVGDEITADSQMLCMEGKKDRSRLLVYQIPVQGRDEISRSVEKMIANVGEKIVFSSPEGEFYGTCTGYTVMDDQSWQYMFSEGGRSVLCKNGGSNYKDPGYYLMPEDVEDLSKLSPETTIRYSYVCFGDVLTVPVECIHQEKSGENRNAYYVWRIVDGEMAKEYVTIDEALNNGTDQVIYSGLKPGDVIAI